MTKATPRDVRRATGLGLVFSSVSLTVWMASFFWPRRDQGTPSDWAWRDGHLLCLPPTSTGLSAFAHFLGMVGPPGLLLPASFLLGLCLAGSPGRWFVPPASGGRGRSGAV
jgi:hypothetical protein